MSSEPLAPPRGRESERSPLPKHMHPRVVVSDDTVARWKREAEQTISELLMDRESWYYRFDKHVQQDDYRILYDKGGVIQGGGRLLPKSSPDEVPLVEFVWHAHLQISLEDIVVGMHCESTFELRALFAQLFPNVCLDGAILQLFEGAVDDDPFHCVSVKWIVFTTPLRKIISYRDYVYFEYCCSVQDAFGRRVLIEYKKSVDVSDLDQFSDHRMDIKRGTIFMFNTYHVEQGEVVNTLLGNLRPGAHMPSWISIKYLPVIFGRVMNTEGVAHTMALLQAGVRSSTLLPARRPGSPTHCHVCTKKFGLAQRKSWCRTCGVSACRSGCTRKLMLPKDGLQIATHLPFTRKRFCLRCITFALQLRARNGHSIGGGDGYQMRAMRATDLSEASVDSFFGYLGSAESTAGTPSASSIVDLEHSLDGLFISHDKRPSSSSPAATASTAYSSENSLYPEGYDML